MAEKIKTMELVKALAEATSQSKNQVHEVIKAMPEVLQNFLKEEKAVPINGVGILQPKRVAKNPKAWNPTKQEYYARPSYINVTFKKSSALKALLNGEEAPTAEE